MSIELPDYMKLVPCDDQDTMTQGQIKAARKSAFAAGMLAAYRVMTSGASATYRQSILYQAMFDYTEAMNNPSLRAPTMTEIGETNANPT